MEKILSIIVPVYNVESYLRQCIDSVLSQKLDNYEIILVNDGSTDKSGLICEEYNQKYDHIKLINQNNSGQSVARNQGVKAAKGRYIAFLDSDDYYLDNILIKLPKIIETNQPDIIINKVMLCYEETSIKKPKCNYNDLNKVSGMTGEEAFRYLVETKQFLVSPYSYIVKRDLIINNNLCFNETKRYAEDIPFALELYFNAKKVQVLDEYLVGYRKGREGQLTAKANLKRDRIVMNILQDLFNRVDIFNISIETKKVLEEYLANAYVGYLGSQYMYSCQEQKSRADIFRTGQALVLHSTDKRIVLGKLIYRIFGFNVYIKYVSYLKSIYRKLH